MKIGLVSAYDYAHPGGVTEHVRHLAAGLRRRGHDVTVFAPCSDKELAERDTDFIRVGRPFPIPMHGSVARITVSLHLTNKIKHLAEKPQIAREPCVGKPVARCALGGSAIQDAHRRGFIHTHCVNRA